MADVMPIRKTAVLLITQSDNLTFDAEDLILYRTRSFTKETQNYLTDLVCNARRVALDTYNANALVGASDEGSETGDVGLWLGHGEYGKGKEENVLKSLGLPESWLETLKEEEEPELLKGLEVELKDRYCFSVTPGYVYFFYIGQFDDGWGGLVAAGVWT